MNFRIKFLGWNTIKSASKTPSESTLETPNQDQSEIRQYKKEPNKDKTITLTKSIKHMEKPNKTRIYNLIILDKSGSMHDIRKAAYEGCNEVLNGIRAAAEKHSENQ